MAAPRQPEPKKSFWGANEGQNLAPIDSLDPPSKFTLDSGIWANYAGSDVNSHVRADVHPSTLQ